MPDITKGHAFSSGESCTAAKLNSLVDDAVINNDAIGADQIAANAVTNAKISASAAISHDKLANLGAAGELLVGNVDKVPTSVALSGDITTVSAAGLVTIADDAITTAKVLDANITGPKIAMTSDARGDILIRGAANYERLAKPGTPAGEVLTFATSATDPAWAAPAAVAVNYAQAEITGVKQIYNHTTGDQDEANGGTKGAEDSFYLYTDGTDSLDATLTRGVLSSKVKIEFVLNADCNSVRGWWGKVQSSLDDGASWADTLVGDVGPGGGSDLRRRVQFSALYRHSTHALGQISFSYIHTPGGGTGEEAVRYRVIVGVQASHRIMVNYGADEGNTVPRPTGNGGVHLIRAVSHMTLTEILV